MQWMRDLATMTTAEIEALSLACSRELRNRQFRETGFGGTRRATDAELLAWGPSGGHPPSPRMAALLSSE